MSEKKKVQVTKPFTYAGAEFGEGLHPEMPEAAARYAEKRKFGRILGEKAPEAEISADFTALSLEETVKRMSRGDFADEVLDSMKVHRDAITEHAKSGKPMSELFSGESTNSKTDGGQSGEENNQKTENEKETEKVTGLPDDFPMKHVFENPNILNSKGFSSVEEIQKHSLEELISIDGIAEKTAKKALAYGK